MIDQGIAKCDSARGRSCRSREPLPAVHVASLDQAVMDLGWTVFFDKSKGYIDLCPECAKHEDARIGKLLRGESA